MAKLHSLLGFTTLSTALVLTSLASCTVGDGDDDDDGGAGGESAEGGTKPTGGTSSGGTSASGGSGGATGGAGAGGGGAGGEGGAVPPGGAGGAGGAPDKVCEGEGGAGAGSVAAEGVSCMDYCSAFFDSCASFIDDAGFTSEADCVETCQNFLNEQLCCRAFNVLIAGEGGAGGGASSDCARAAGNDTCN